MAYIINGKEIAQTIKDEMKEEVLNKIASVNSAISVGVPPEKDEGKCTYCDYKRECKLIDEGKWVDTRPQEPPKKAKASNTKGKSKKGRKTADTIPTDAEILYEALGIDDLQESGGCY